MKQFFLLLAVCSPTALQAASPESCYVKQPTWVESMLATRAALEKIPLRQIRLSPWRPSTPLPAAGLDAEPAGKEPVPAHCRGPHDEELFRHVECHGMAPVRADEPLRPRTIRYLDREISVAKPTRCQLQIACDAALAVWLNGTCVQRRAEPAPGEKPAPAGKPAAPIPLSLALELREGVNRLLIKTFASRAGRIVLDMPEARLDRDRLADDLFRHFWEDFAQTDWLAQDAPQHRPGESDAWRDFGWYFAADRTAEAEQALIRRVLDEIGPAGAKLAAQLDELVKSGRGIQSPAWLNLYVEACQVRRRIRLHTLEQQCPRLIFTRHTTLGGSHYAYTEAQSDAQAERHFLPGSALCLATLHDGRVQVETLLADPLGMLRDPDVSYDGRRVLFAWKKSDREDDFHLYEMDLASRAVRQLTFGLGVADYEGAYLPDGDVLFNSTRCVQTVDCWWSEVSNLYRCDRDGRFIRRLTFDQVHDNFPTLTDDGRVLYTRWEYNDRGQIYPQPLLQMNPDGTNQAEFYGVNSWFPTTILHARNIPCTQKVLALAAGHHTRQTGKLIVIDPGRGRQENAGVQLVAPVRDTPAVKIDAYGQSGELFQYPYPLDQRHYLVAWHPLGWAWADHHGPRFAVYWMASDGRREQLIADPTLPCGQPIPLRTRGGTARPSEVDYGRTDATCYIQNVYAGAGLQGLARGTVKRLRVVSLDFRAAGIGVNFNGGPGGGALISTPVSIGNGAWDPKIILGDATVYDDGSAMFRVPARRPIYFQLLDQRGRMVQSMRSWTTLQPGEKASCVGCHENKNQAPLARMPLTIAAGRGIERLRPFGGGPGGLSFRRDIQPILDRNCVACHNGDPQKLPDLRGRDVADASAKRNWTTAYLALTHAEESDRKGHAGAWRGSPDHPLVNWISAQSAPTLLPPLSAGSNRSRLIALLDAGHEKVKLSPDELGWLATWIDLGVPFAGDYREAAAWTAEESARYERYLAKRQQLAADETAAVAALAAGHASESSVLDDPPVTLSIELLGRGGQALAARSAAATALAPLVLSSPRRPEPGDRIRISGAQHLALRIGPGMPQAMLYAPDAAVEYVVPCTTSAARPGATPYPPQAFADEPPQITARPVTRRELDAYRNLAANPYDLGDAATQFPHASANSQCRHEPVFAARNAIDGCLRNDHHGGWPFQSWGPEKQKELWWQVDFGREVEVDRVTLYLRADFPHDKYWRRATLVFSDGRRQPLALEKTAQPQTVTFPPHKTTSLRLADLASDEPLGWCALTEFEAWGRDPLPIVRDLAKLGAKEPNGRR